MTKEAIPAWLVHVNGDLQKIEIVDNIMYPGCSKPKSDTFYIDFNSFSISEDWIHSWITFVETCQVFLTTDKAEADLIAKTLRIGIEYENYRLKKVFNQNMQKLFS